MWTMSQFPHLWNRKIRLQHLNKIAPTWLAASVQGGELHLPESPLLHAGLLWIKKGTRIRFGRWKQNRDNMEDCGRQTQWWADTEVFSGYQPVIVRFLLCIQLTFQTAGLDNQQWSSVPHQALGPSGWFSERQKFPQGRSFHRRGRIHRICMVAKFPSWVDFQMTWLVVIFYILLYLLPYLHLPSSYHICVNLHSYIKPPIVIPIVVVLISWFNSDW